MNVKDIVTNIRKNSRAYIWGRYTGQTKLHRAENAAKLDKVSQCMMSFRGFYRTDESDEPEVLERAWISLYHETYAEMMAGERNHRHRIIKDEHGTFRWEAFPKREAAILDMFGAKDLNELYTGGQTDKNDPLVRQLYRCMGYSLSGYHEIFYWDWNNDIADEWDPDKDDAHQVWDPYNANGEPYA